MSAPTDVRASGLTQAEEVTREVAKEADEPVKVELPEERIRKFLTPGFSRMRANWEPEEQALIRGMQGQINQVLQDAFPEVYSLLYEVYDLVREVEIDPATGEPRMGPDGLPMWKRAPSGRFVEDWVKIGHRQRDDMLYAITVGLIRWKQRASDIWGEAMMAKAKWEEAFSNGYLDEENVRRTVDERTARGRSASADDRYFAIYVSTLSRKADALISSMELLGQRIKDLHTM